MAFGDCLKKKLFANIFLSCEDKKTSQNAFWVVLRNAAVEDIRNIYPQKIDSDRAVSIYYTILSNNMDYLPDFVCVVLPSNGQERFRVINRNMFTSNSFHLSGLANHPNIIAKRVDNDNRKGEKIIFQWKEERNDGDFEGQRST